MATLAKKKKKVQVGDEVDIQLGATVWHVKVANDRGPIGLNGRRMLRVLILDGTQDELPQYIEVPAEYVIRR